MIGEMDPRLLRAAQDFLWEVYDPPNKRAIIRVIEAREVGEQVTEHAKISEVRGEKCAVMTTPELSVILTPEGNGGLKLNNLFETAFKQGRFTENGMKMLIAAIREFRTVNESELMRRVKRKCPSFERLKPSLSPGD